MSLLGSIPKDTIGNTLSIIDMILTRLVRSGGGSRGGRHRTHHRQSIQIHKISGTVTHLAHLELMILVIEALVGYKGHRTWPCKSDILGHRVRRTIDANKAFLSRRVLDKHKDTVAGRGLHKRARLVSATALSKSGQKREAMGVIRRINSNLAYA